MSDLQQGTNSSPSQSSKEEAAKTNALIAYGLMVIGLFTGIFWIIGAIWAMVKKDDARGTIFEDHYSNIIKTFWWGFILTFLGFILLYFIIGYFILLAVFILSVYRIIKGLAKITSNKAYNS